jgi:hypothetical protein
VSADEHPVGATWKLRVIVYGSLLVIGVLVLATRPGGPPSLRTLRGTTGQGYPVEMTMDRRHVHAFAIKWISARCNGGRSGGTYWTPTVGQPNFRYDEHGQRIEAHEWPKPPSTREEGVWMHARVYNDGHNVDGTIAYRENGCASGPVRLSASG